MTEQNREYLSRLMDAFEVFVKTWKELSPDGNHISAWTLDGGINIIDFDKAKSPMVYRHGDGERYYSEDI